MSLVDEIFAGHFNYTTENGQAGTRHITVADLHAVLTTLEQRAQEEPAKKKEHK